MDQSLSVCRLRSYGKVIQSLRIVAYRNTGIFNFVFIWTNCMKFLSRLHKYKYTMECIRSLKCWGKIKQSKFHLSPQRISYLSSKLILNFSVLPNIFLIFIIFFSIYFLISIAIMIQYLNPHILTRYESLSKMSKL